MSTLVRATLVACMTCLPLCLPAADDVSWKITEHKNSQDIALSIHTFRAISNTAKDFSCTVILIDPKIVRAQLYINDQQVPENEVSQQAQSQKAIAGINGGYFDVGFKAVGLLKSNSHILQATSDKPLLSGIIGIDESGNVIIRKGAMYGTLPSAIQSGPLLIEADGSKGIYSNNKKYAHRSLIGTTQQGQTVLIQSSHISLYELCLFLHQQQKTLGIDGLHNVINLDGGPSSGIYAKNKDTSVIKIAGNTCKTNILFFHRDK